MSEVKQNSLCKNVFKGNCLFTMRKKKEKKILPTTKIIFLMKLRFLTTIRDLYKKSN